MDSVLRNILDIDKKTAKLSEETEQKLAQNDETLLKLLETRENEIREEARRESDRAYEEIMQSARMLVEEKQRKGEKQRATMESRYAGSSDALAEQLLKELLEN